MIYPGWKSAILSKSSVNPIKMIQWRCRIRFLSNRPSLRGDTVRQISQICGTRAQRVQRRTLRLEAPLRALRARDAILNSCGAQARVPGFLLSPS